MGADHRLSQLLDQAIDLDRAVKGNIQVFVPETDSLEGVLSTHSPSIRWELERDNTRHIAAEIALIFSQPHLSHLR